MTNDELEDAALIEEWLAWRRDIRATPVAEVGARVECYACERDARFVDGPSGKCVCREPDCISSGWVRLIPLRVVPAAVPEESTAADADLLRAERAVSDWLQHGGGIEKMLAEAAAAKAAESPAAMPRADWYLRTLLEQFESIAKAPANWRDSMLYSDDRIVDRNVLGHFCAEVRLLLANVPSSCTTPAPVAGERVRRKCVVASCPCHDEGIDGAGLGCCEKCLEPAPVAGERVRRCVNCDTPAAYSGVDGECYCGSHGPYPNTAAAPDVTLRDVCVVLAGLLASGNLKEPRIMKDYHVQAQYAIDYVKNADAILRERARKEGA